MTPISVCFATPGVWPLLAGTPAVFGGSELRALTFLRALAQEPDWVVSLIAFDVAPALRSPLAVRVVPDRYHAGRDRLIDRVIDVFSRTPGGPEMPVAAGEARAWRQACAAVYVAFGVGDYTAKLAAWCRGNGRRLVLVAGSDADFDEHYRSDDTGLNPYGSRNALCRFALDNADMVICQSVTQAALLDQRFGRHGVVVRNPVEVGDVLQGARRHALWLGKTDKVKRPELFVELARACPEVPCVLVANPIDRRQFESLRQSAPANLTIRESVPRESLDALIADSFCIVNTSLFEGFPNAFLDAGRQAVPVLSLAVDPDRALAESGGGICTGGALNRLAADMRALHAAPQDGVQMGMRWRAYVQSHHDARTQTRAFADALRRAASVPATDAA